MNEKTVKQEQAIVTSLKGKMGASSFKDFKHHIRWKMGLAGKLQHSWVHSRRCKHRVREYDKTHWKKMLGRPLTTWGSSD